MSINQLPDRAIAVTEIVFEEALIKPVTNACKFLIKIAGKLKYFIRLATACRTALLYLAYSCVAWPIHEVMLPLSATVRQIITILLSYSIIIYGSMILPVLRALGLTSPELTRFFGETGRFLLGVLQYSLHASMYVAQILFLVFMFFYVIFMHVVCLGCH